MSSWFNTTDNGTRVYTRSGFTAWAIPIAYQTLVDAGAVPRWSPEQLRLFKRAVDSWLNPWSPVASNGILEAGNWNKGFQHLANVAAVLRVFPEIDTWAVNRGRYRAYLERWWRSWVDQHC